MQKRILVIDDDELMLGALDSFLVFENFLTETVVSAKLIDQALAGFKPDLIIMDIRLDAADGRLICDELKGKSGSSGIPIILLTGLSYREIALIDCKADAIIGKPYESSSLLNTIDQLLKGLASYGS
ncbi:response regulator transcription factor [Pedobacter psychrodurus]|uniref:response regulator transcription factor n=1 Tax=Pedobacter psychrodurus TaxID=2530456 RepID=UPI00292E824A|nr:response regulator [Pedobacter psychrodurus]